MNFLIGIIATLLVSSARLAGAETGTYQTPAPRGDLVPAAQELLSTRSDLQTTLSRLQLEPLGHSAYLWPSEPSPLRGVRVGPFWLLAKPKGTVGPPNLRIVISTRKRFLDPDGNEVPSWKGAATIQQTVESVQVAPLDPPDPSLLGTWRLVASKGPAATLLSSARWTFVPTRRFEAVQITGDGHPANLSGYFLNDGGKLTLAEVDSGTFQLYDYEVDAGTLRIESADESGKPVLEWTFQLE